MKNETPYLRDTAVAARYSISRPSIWRWVKEGKFPKPVKFGIRSTRWSLADLEAWELAQAHKDNLQ